jgi:MFS family permease
MRTAFFPGNYRNAPDPHADTHERLLHETRLLISGGVRRVSSASAGSAMDNAVSPSRAWAAFILGTLYFGYAFAQRVAPSVMTGELMRDLSVGGAALGGLSAFYFYAYAGIQLPVGMLVDRFGPRKLLSSALLLCAVASVGFAWSETVLGASIGRALIGGTVAFGFVGTLAIATYWFPPSRFAMLSGIVLMVGMLGAIAGQAPLRMLVEILGWRDTMLALGAAGAVLGVLLYLVIPNRPRDKAARAAGERHPLAGLRDVVTNPQSWFCAAIGFGPTSTLLAFSGLWAVPWLSTVRGFPVSEAAAISSVVFVGWAVGAPLLGWVSDHIGRRKPVILAGLSLSLAALCLIIFGGISNTIVLITLFFLNGVGSCAMVVCFGAARELNRAENSATALGLVNMFVVGSGAVLQPLIGWLLDLNWGGGMLEGARVYDSSAYAIAFTTLIGANAVGLLCGFALRETYCRPLEER